MFNLDEDILDLCKEDFTLPEESAEFDPEIIEELRNATLEYVDEEMQNHLQSIIKTHASVCETPEPEMKIENIQFKIREQCQHVGNFSYNFVDPEVAKSFLQELTDLYTRYYTQLAGPEGVLEFKSTM